MGSVTLNQQSSADWTRNATADAPLVAGRPETTGARATRIVGCVIARDEERFIVDCLTSLRRVCDCVIVVDTGSKDRTPELARPYANVVTDFAFDDDFSKARNYALDIALDQAADADWVLFLDADERLAESEARTLVQVISDTAPEVGALRLLRYNFMPTGGFYTSEELRVFRVSTEIRYEGAIFESVKCSLDKGGWGARLAPVRLTHVGYCRPRAERELKMRRYTTALVESFEQEPRNAVLAAYLGLIARLRGDFIEGLEWTARALRIDDGDPVVWLFRGHALRAMGDVAGACEAYSHGLAVCPDDPALVNMRGVCEAADGRLDAAEESFMAVRRISPIRVHADVNLGLIAEARGEYQRAYTLYRQAALDYPDLLTEEPIGRLEVDPLHCLYFETVTTYAGLSRHLAYASACLANDIQPRRICCKVLTGTASSAYDPAPHW